MAGGRPCGGGVYLAFAAVHPRGDGEQILGTGGLVLAENSADVSSPSVHRLVAGGGHEAGELGLEAAAVRGGTE